VDSAADDLSSPVSLSRMLTDLELDSPAGLMIFWQPDSSQIMRDYLINATGNESSGGNISQYVANLFGELCQRCSTFRAMAVFLSMADLPDGAGYAFYEYLKNESVGDSGRLVWPEKAINTYALSDHDAVLELWNFSQSHHTMGWLAGSGVSSCVTDHSPLLSGYAQSESREYIRALRAKMDHNGIVLCRFEDTRSFRDIEGLDFTVALDHADGAADATLVFVIGTEDTRAEFTVENVACGQVHSFHCGLSEYPYIDVIDYVGVIVYADSEVTLDIGQISVHSSKLDEEALTSLVTSGAEDAGKKTDYRLALILCAVTIVMSVAAVTAITRHENEEAEALPEESGRRSGIRGGGRT